MHILDPFESISSLGVASVDDIPIKVKLERRKECLIFMKNMCEEHLIHQYI